MEIEFDDVKSAKIIYDTVIVDEELTPDKVKRTVVLNGSKMNVYVINRWYNFLGL